MTMGGAAIPDFSGSSTIFEAIPIKSVFWVDLNDYLHLQLINFFIYFFKAFVVELQRGHQVGFEAVITGCLSSYFLRLRFVDAVSYLLDTVDKEQGGYDGPYYWPNSGMWEPAVRWFPEMIIPAIYINEGGVIVVLFVHNDFLRVD